MAHVIDDQMWAYIDCFDVARGCDDNLTAEVITEHASALVRRVKSYGVIKGQLARHRHYQVGDGYNEFSHLNCDVCNSRLGGARYQLVLLGD